MKFKERRVMNRHALQTLCISHGWFTRGTNEDFDKLLAMTNENNITSEHLYEMAQMIMNHSDNIRNGVAGVMFCLGEICYTFFSIEG